MTIIQPDATHAWKRAARDIINLGLPVSPRGQNTLELPQNTVCFDMKKPVMRIRERKLSHVFMAAEAYWILSGDNRVSTIRPFNKNISQFSDDGEKFYGAYGPKIIDQLDYVVNKLLEDMDSRQAGLTIWRENPKPSKDIPCTVAIFFNIRNFRLNCHVFMRSSDIWWGLPYDMFNFSMLSHLVTARIRLNSKTDTSRVVPGNLYLTAGSMHAYERNFDDIHKTLAGETILQPRTPVSLYTDENCLMNTLEFLRFTNPADDLRWWEHEV